MSHEILPPRATTDIMSIVSVGETRRGLVGCEAGKVGSGPSQSMVEEEEEEEEEDDSVTVGISSRALTSPLG